MDKTNLHEEFIKALIEKIPKRSDLINIISDLLIIEREPASRRLSGKVLFSIQEMGLLAKKFEISLDHLLHKDEKYQWIPMFLKSPVSISSVDLLWDRIYDMLNHMSAIAQEPTRLGYVLNSLPIEFFVHHPDLMKFMFFKWGYYFVGTEEFDNYSQWVVPEKMSTIKDDCEALFENITNTFYIWDTSIIWTLAKEIQIFYEMHVITTEEKDAIKNDLKASLINLEQYLKGTFKPRISSPNLEFHVSTLNLGFTCWYLSTMKRQAFFFQTNFTYSTIEEGYSGFEHMEKWMHSLTEVSVLLSKSGQVHRRLFFEEQHNIIDSILG